VTLANRFEGVETVAEPSQRDVRQLNSFLRGELSAIETYTQAIEKIENAKIRSELEQCRSSHRKRANLLREYIIRLGGDPAESSGIWGGFAKVVEGSASAFGESAALAALEEGEDHGRNDYKRDITDLSPAVQSFVRNDLMTEQQRTHAAMSRLKHAA
jgi:hypothetical protein